MIFSDFDAPKELFDAYLRGVAKNRSIEELVFSEPYENKWGGIFRILAPFLANNSNLRQLTVSCWENVPDAEFLSLALTLSVVVQEVCCRQLISVIAISLPKQSWI